MSTLGLPQRVVRRAKKPKATNADENQAPYQHNEKCGSSTPLGKPQQRATGDSDSKPPAAPQRTIALKQQSNVDVHKSGTMKRVKSKTPAKGRSGSAARQQQQQQQQRQRQRIKSPVNPIAVYEDKLDTLNGKDAKLGKVSATGTSFNCGSDGSGQKSTVAATGLGVSADQATISAEELASFFQTHDPPRMRKVQLLLDGYSTADIVKNLQSKYGTAPSPMTTVQRLQKKLDALHAEHRSSVDEATAIQTDLKHRCERAEKECATAQLENRGLSEELRVTQERLEQVSASNTRMQHFLADHGYDAESVGHHEQQAKEDAALHLEMQEALQVLASDNEIMKQQLKQAVAMLSSIGDASFEQLEQNAKMMACLEPGSSAE